MLQKPPKFTAISQWGETATRQPVAIPSQACGGFRLIEAGLAKVVSALNIKPFAARAAQVT
jgi:hypothetical protein